MARQTAEIRTTFGFGSFSRLGEIVRRRGSSRWSCQSSSRAVSAEALHRAVGIGHGIEQRLRPRARRAPGPRALAASERDEPVGILQRVDQRRDRPRILDRAQRGDGGAAHILVGSFVAPASASIASGFPVRPRTRTAPVRISGSLSCSVS